MERTAPGAFARSIASRGQRLRVIYEHGNDPRIGRKPLGGRLTFEDGPAALIYTAPLLDTTYTADLLPGLQAGVFGSSVRFRPTGVGRNRYPTRSEYNPDAIEERTVNVGDLFGISVTPFPVYAGSSAGIRADGVTVADLDGLLAALDAYLAA